MDDAKRERDERVESKIDRISDQISEINVTLTAQHASLSEHIRRTNILEEKIMPLETKFYEFRGMIKLGGLILAILSAAAAIAEIVGYISRVK